MSNLRPIERYLKSLANVKRLNIISYLMHDGVSSVGDIAQAIHLKVRPTSKHLQILESAGIVDRRKKGLLVFYKLSNKKAVVLQAVLKML